MGEVAAWNQLTIPEQQQAARIAMLEEKLSKIANICDAPQWTMERRYKIRDIATS